MSEPYRRSGAAGFSTTSAEPPVGKASVPEATTTTGGTLGIDGETVLVDGKPVDPAANVTIQAADLAKMYSETWSAAWSAAIKAYAEAMLPIVESRAEDTRATGDAARRADVAKPPTNGPVDVQIEYDRQGRMARVIRPDYATRIERDSQGRLTAMVREAPTDRAQTRSAPTRPRRPPLPMYRD